MSSIEDPLNKLIGANLRYCRILRKLTMSDVAAVIGVAHQQVYKYEVGINSLTVFRLKQFAEFYKEQIPNLINPDYISIMCKLVEANFFNTSDHKFVIGSVNLASMADLKKNITVKDYQNTTLHLNFDASNYEQFASEYPGDLNNLENDPKMKATYDDLASIGKVKF